MTCVWYDYDSKTYCGNEDSQVHNHVELCAEHKEVQRVKWESKGRGNILRSLDYHPLDAFPGFCYIALMPDGLIKIGYSNTDELYGKRLVSLSRQAGAPVIELAKIPGGFVAETYLHEKFRAYRVPGPGERFTYSPEIAEYISSTKK